MKIPDYLNKTKDVEITQEDLTSLDEDTFLSVFEGVPQFTISKTNLNAEIIDLLSTHTKIFQSKGEVRRMIANNAVSVNKEKINIDYKLSNKNLISDKYLLIQKGKKNYFLIIVS